MNNAFTLKEMLLTLLIVSLLASFSTPVYDPLSIGMKQIQAACLDVQMEAYAKKTKIDVVIEKDRGTFGKKTIEFDRFACSPMTFHYNEKGNISKGGRLVCSSAEKERSIVYQIGMGRMRIE